MKEFRADLHCHTQCSDGSLSPRDLIDLAVASRLQGISITDHDTIQAYKDIIPYAKEKGLLLGTGIEFSAHYDDKSVHILGYDFSLESEELSKLCHAHLSRRNERNHNILKKLKTVKKPIEETELKGHGMIGRPHIAQAMIERGYVQSMREAFNIYLGDHGCCFEKGPMISVEETLNVIHAAGGKAFLAHPHLMQGGKLIKELLKLPFDGIECYYAKCGPDIERRWVRMAKEKKLLMSGGSDFHGDMKSHIPLGCSWVNEETFHAIFQNNLICPR